MQGFGRLRQEDLKFIASIGYIVSSKTAWDVYRIHSQEKKRKRKEKKSPKTKQKMMSPARRYFEYVKCNLCKNSFFLKVELCPHLFSLGTLSN
jgi:hypothetical protein